MANDHINTIERKLIDNLRNGTYSTTAGVDSGSAWSTTDVKVFGQFPLPEDIKYPCIVVEMTANGTEEQFVGQRVTSGSTEAVGELYGVGYQIHLAVDNLSAITVEWSNATCDTTDTSTTVNMDNTSLITVGATISGSGIPAGATVSSITSSTAIVISAAATATATNVTLDFSAAYKQRRLLNYLMLNCADVLMDADFSQTDVQVVQRLYNGFSDVGYNPEREVWFSTASMIIVFLNTR